MSIKMSKNNKKKDEKKDDSDESDLESEISDIIEDDIEKFDEENISDIEEDDNDDDDDIEIKKENDNEDEINCFYDIEQNEINNIQNNDVAKEDRITMPFLTKYERVRILGKRAKQISLGAKILVKDIDLTTKTPIEIAKIELSHGIIPIKIRRPLPNGKVEEWKLSELIDKIKD